MSNEILEINIKEIGEEIAKNCIDNHSDNLLIDYLYKEANYTTDDIKEKLIDFALEYLDKNNINYIM